MCCVLSGIVELFCSGLATMMMLDIHKESRKCALEGLPVFRNKIGKNTKNDKIENFTKKAFFD